VEIGRTLRPTAYENLSGDRKRSTYGGEPNAAKKSTIAAASGRETSPGETDR
jgi:hypothetical protein